MFTCKCYLFWEDLLFLLEYFQKFLLQSVSRLGKNSFLGLKICIYGHARMFIITYKQLAMSVCTYMYKDLSQTDTQTDTQTHTQTDTTSFSHCSLAASICFPLEFFTWAMASDMSEASLSSTVCLKEDIWPSREDCSTPSWVSSVEFSWKRVKRGQQLLITTWFNTGWGSLNSQLANVYWSR